MRITYDKSILTEEQLAATPLEQFQLWLRDAVDDPSILEPNAMVLATSESSPTTRTVLLKAIDDRGLSFYTNYGSRKAAQMAANNAVSVLFPWYSLHRQVSVIGTVSQVSREESAEYFETRPHTSQLGAHASAQSTPIASREPLETAMAQLEEQYPEGTQVPLPENWGGYLITVDSIEFWQGRRSRLHDRLRFERVGSSHNLSDAHAWKVQRYSP
jgi:pyridoxamine 5'-phosphate oxidase